MEIAELNLKESIKLKLKEEGLSDVESLNKYNWSEISDILGDYSGKDAFELEKALFEVGITIKYERESNDMSVSEYYSNSRDVEKALEEMKKQKDQNTEKEMSNQGQREMGVSGDTANLLKRYVEEEYNCVTSYKGFTEDAYYFEASGNEFRIKIEKENGYRMQEQEKSEGTWKEIDSITNNDLKKFLEKDVQYAAIDKLSTEKEFRNFLDIQAKFPYYSLDNQLLLYKQEREKDVPNITMIQGKSRWEQLGEKIKKGVQALTLRVPVLNKQNDKTIINDSKSVKVYDISQIHEPKLAVPTQLNNEKMYERFKKYVNDIAPTRLDEQAKFRDSLSQYIEIQSKQSVKPYRPYPEEHRKAIEQAVAYVVLKHYNLPLENMKLDQVVAIAAADLDIKKSIFKEAHHISQKTIDLCNRITHELKLEKNTDLFKEKRNEKIQDRERSLER